MSLFSKKTKKEVTEQNTVSEPTTRKNSKKEHLMGAVILGGLILVVIFGLAGLGFGTYSLWQQQSMESQAPSISTLPTTETPIEDVPVQEESRQDEMKAVATTETAPTTSDDTLKKAQALDVIVMNGGGAKGVAGEAASLLKGKGFTKTTVGNTIGNFTGTTVYSKKENQASAEAVVALLKASYPTVTYKEAPTTDKEAQTASITVIFGK